MHKKKPRSPISRGMVTLVTLEGLSFHVLVWIFKWSTALSEYHGGFYREGGEGRGMEGEGTLIPRRKRRTLLENKFGRVSKIGRLSLTFWNGLSPERTKAFSFAAIGKILPECDGAENLGGNMNYNAFPGKNSPLNNALKPEGSVQETLLRANFRAARDTASKITTAKKPAAFGLYES